MLDLTGVLSSKTVIKKKHIVKELMELTTYEDMFNDEEIVHLNGLDAEDAKQVIYDKLVEKLEEDPNYEIWDNLHYYPGWSAQIPITEDCERYSYYTFISSKGRIINFNNPTLKHKGHVWGDGYGYFSGIFTEYKYSTIKLHRAVASTFIPKNSSLPYCLLQPNHLNSCKLENDVLNLEWVTSKENTIHAHENGLVKIDSGMDDKQTKPVVVTLLTESPFTTSFVIAGRKEMEECNFDPSAVSRVCQGKVMTHHKCSFKYAGEDDLETIPRITEEAKKFLSAM